MTPLFVADVGSSFLKVGLFDREDRRPLPEPLRVATIDSQNGTLDDLAADAPGETALWRVISVRQAGQQRLARWVQKRFPRAEYRVLSYRDLPLEVNIEQPEKVGVDRLAAAVAANALRQPDRAAVVVDSGTAITVDLLDRRGVFQGGAILPGVRLSARALHQQTDALPEISLSLEGSPPRACGRNTRQALESGLYWGAVGAVRELIAQLTEEADSPPPQVFLSGGDGRLISTVLGASAQFTPHLALRGAALAEQGWR